MLTACIPVDIVIILMLILTLILVAMGLVSHFLWRVLTFTPDEKDL